MKMYFGYRYAVRCAFRLGDEHINFNNIILYFLRKRHAVYNLIYIVQTGMAGYMIMICFTIVNVITMHMYVFLFMTVS